MGKQLGRTKKIGPFPFSWLSSSENQINTLCDKLPSGQTAIPVASLRPGSEDPLLAEALRQVRRQCMLSGTQVLKPGDLRNAAGSFIRTAMNFGAKGESEGRVGMSIKSAKNREFENVVVLWPHEIVGDDLMRRKLLYNAVTRARRRAVIIAQGGEKRLSTPELRLLSRHQA